MKKQVVDRRHFQRAWQNETIQEEKILSAGSLGHLTCCSSASCWCVATARSSFPSSPRTSWRLTSRVIAPVRSACWSATTWSSPSTRDTSTATSCESSAELLSSQILGARKRLARCSSRSVMNVRLEICCRRVDNMASKVVAKNTDNLSFHYYP